MILLIRFSQDEIVPERDDEIEGISVYRIPYFFLDLGRKLINYLGLFPNVYGPHYKLKTIILEFFPSNGTLLLSFFDHFHFCTTKYWLLVDVATLFLMTSFFERKKLKLDKRIGIVYSLL